MKAEMFLMEEPCGQSNHLILIGLLYMVDSVNVGLINIDVLAQPGTLLHFIGSAPMKCRSVPGKQPPGWTSRSGRWIGPLGIDVPDASEGAGISASDETICDLGVRRRPGISLPRFVSQKMWVLLTRPTSDGTDIRHTS